MQKGFSEDIGHSSVLEKKISGNGTCTYKPEGTWDKDANLMIEHFEESGHPVFQGISALNRGI